MRRHTANAAVCRERASHALKLDPSVLPVRYASAHGQGGGRAPAQIYLDRERVVMKRAVGDKIAMTVTLPVSAFRGVAARLHGGEGGVVASLTLLHHDAALSLPLYEGDDPHELVGAWAAWGEALGLPLVVFDEAGEPRSVEAGPDLSATPQPRRRHSHFAARRPRFLTRRKTGARGAMGKVEGREIIART